MKNTYYGLTEQQWEAAKDEIRPILIGIAKTHDQITYADLAHLLTAVHLEPDSHALHALLGALSEESINNGLLSAVVVRQEDRMPGDGFFSLAEHLYEKKIKDPLIFYAEELAKVHERWGTFSASAPHHSPIPIPRLSPTLLERHFNLFRQYVEEQDGQPLRSFSYGFLDREEGYKGRLYEEARATLDFPSWTEKDIGSGNILERVIAAIERKDNNIVKYQPRYGETSREHRALLEAREHAENRQQWEQTLYRLFHDDDSSSDHAVFERMVQLAGKRYALLSYLFFLKNKRKYAPISPTNFDRAFAALGLPTFTTSHQCSWENYCAFLALIGQVEIFLREEMQEAVDLLDAHSFLWIVSRDLVKRSTSVRPVILIPEELQLQPVEKAALRKTGYNGPVLYDEAAQLLEQREHGKTGRIAEELVRDAEVAALQAAGRDDLAKRVQIKSQDMALGYDILSFAPDGSEKHIEVKGTKTPDGHVFYLTANELLRSQETPSYFLYIVTGVGTPQPRIHYVTGPDFRSEHFALEPLSYRVRYAPKR